MRALIVLGMLVLGLHVVESAFGDVYTWGRGLEGQLGHDNVDQQNFPVLVSDMIGKKVKTVDAGKDSTTAVTADGKVYMWGGENSKKPILVPNLEGQKVVQFTVGNCHFAVLTVKGEVWTWGCAEKGATGHGQVCSGCKNDIPRLVPGLQGRNVRQLVSGGDHTAVLTDNGEVWVWGSGESGEVGNGLFLNQGNPTKVEVLNNIRICQICAGEDHMGAVDTKGNLYTWGANNDGQLGIGRSYERLAEPRLVRRFQYPDSVAVVSCGHSFTGAVTGSGKVFMWGAGGDALPEEKVFFRGKAPRSITAGRNHVAVVTKSFEVFTWGSNFQGQLGMSLDAVFSLDPQIVDDLIGKRVNMIASGLNHTVALSGQVMPTMCPVFQDWYGPPDSQLHLFEATCEFGGSTCPDKSCCGKGETCVAFNSAAGYGCCVGENMKFCSDDATCCSSGSVCNQQADTCEIAVSYAEASRAFMAYERNTLKLIQNTESLSESKPVGTPLNIVTNEIDDNGELSTAEKLSDSVYRRSGPNAEFHNSAKTLKAPVDQARSTNSLSSQESSPQSTSQSNAPIHSTSPREIQTGESNDKSETFGTPLNVVTDASDGYGERHTAEKLANSEYRRSGLDAAGKAVINEYRKTAVEILNNATGQACTTNPLSSQESSPQRVSQSNKPVHSRETSLPLIVEVDKANAKSDVVRMSRNQLIVAIKKFEAMRESNGAPPDESLDDQISSMSTATLRSVVAMTYPDAVVAQSASSQTIGENGQPISGPFTDVKHAEEVRIAEHSPSIEDVESEEPAIESKPQAPREHMSVGWLNNVHHSEHSAGVHTKDPAILKKLPEHDKKDEAETREIPGAAGIVLPATASQYTASEIARLRASGDMVQTGASARRHGKGPCPASAGSGDCNRDCADADARILDAAGETHHLASELLNDKSVRNLHTPVPSPPPRASDTPTLERTSSAVTRSNATVIRESYGDATIKVALGNSVVHVPPSGLYFDPSSNLTYRFEGDRVYRATPASRFTAMKGRPGSFYKGHCGSKRPTCPDNSCCPEGETCCQQQDGSYGCCPFEEGSCCADQRHCCPAPYHCDLQNKACVFEGSAMGLARFAKVDQGLCDAAQRSCKDGSCCPKENSCCTMADGLQGCSSFVDATCCHDGKHACPEGSTCDTIHEACVDIASGLITAIDRLESSSVPAGVDLVCSPDELTCSSGSCCDSESTCCEDVNGFEQCCPFIDGICCGRGVCCPNGYECDIIAGMCHAAEGDIQTSRVQDGRTPFLVAEACDVKEHSCPGTHDCCAQGTGCCSSLQNSTGSVAPKLVSTCCTHGEDAICCDDGTCCPFRHTCEPGFCVHPDGSRFPSSQTLVSRETENKATSTCISTKDLQGAARKKIKDTAASNKKASTKILIAAEVTKSCPPYCGVDGSFAPGVDDGQWGDSATNDNLLSHPGEAGIHVNFAATEDELMYEERQKAQLLDDLHSAQQYLTKLHEHDNELKELYHIRGSLSFECNWSISSRDSFVDVLRSIVKQASAYDAVQVIIVSLAPGVRAEFQVRHNPPTSEVASRIAKSINNFFQSGQNFSDPSTKCQTKVYLTEPSQAVKIDHFDIAQKLQLLAKLETILLHYSSRFSDIPQHLISLEDLQNAILTLKNDLGLASPATISSLTDDILERLGSLNTLLRSYLAHRASRDDAEGMYLAEKSDSELRAISDSLKTEHSTRRCVRLQHVGGTVGPECEHVQMSLANMHLRELDEHAWDPVLQKEFGIALRLPDGVDGWVEHNPPTSHLSVFQQEMPEP